MGFVRSGLKLENMLFIGLNFLLTIYNHKSAQQKLKPEMSICVMICGSGILAGFKLISGGCGPQGKITLRLKLESCFFLSV